MTTVNGTMNLAFATQSESSKKDLSLLDIGYRLDNSRIKDLDLIVTNLNGDKTKLDVSNWDVDIKGVGVTKKKYTVYSEVKLLIATEVYAQKEEEAFTTAQMKMDDMLAINNVHMSMEHVNGDVVTPKVCDFFINVDEVCRDEE